MKAYYVQRIDPITGSNLLTTGLPVPFNYEKWLLGTEREYLFWFKTLPASLGLSVDTAMYEKRQVIKMYQEDGTLARIYILMEVD